MSLNVEKKNRLKELSAGIHLVTILDAIIVKDADGQPIVSNGEMGVVVRFSDVNNHCYDKEYWLGGSREKYFNQMCAVAGIDRSNPKFKASSKGKRLWIFIREVHIINNDQPVIDDLTGKPEIRYEMFDVAPFGDSNKMPKVPGNPMDNNGIASDDFLTYINIHGEPSEAPKVEKQTEEDPFDNW